MSMMGGPRRRPGPKDTGPKAKFNQLVPYMKEQKGLLSIAVFFSLIGAGVNLAQPLVVGQIISTVQKGEDVLTIALILVAITLGSALTSGAMYFVLAKAGEGVVFSARRKLSTRLLRLPMQAIAKEFNLSETVFLFPPQDLTNRASLRIFTPATELPFAGHPTVGTAVLIALLDGHASLSFGLEEKVGLVACSASRVSDSAGEAIFTLPRLPERIADAAPSSMIAEALGVPVDEIGFDDHHPIVASAGVGFNFIPLKTKDAVTRASIKGANWTDAFKAAGRPNAFVYTRETVEAGHHFHARMFAPHLGIGEDPATGGAAAAFARAFVDFEKPADGTH
ncbi:MAG: PhzF family phenazine biosynthesis isomerase, partial [Actinobacteria bacterium]|nr:PhzF family phenazine biosynthesis isomerase [Actinomycetota bacterium]